MRNYIGTLLRWTGGKGESKYPGLTPWGFSSFWAFASFTRYSSRPFREGRITRCDARDLSSHFSEHVGEGLGNLISVNEGLLRRTRG